MFFLTNLNFYFFKPIIKMDSVYLNNYCLFKLFFRIKKIIKKIKKAYQIKIINRITIINRINKINRIMKDLAFSKS